MNGDEPDADPPITPNDIATEFDPYTPGEFSTHAETAYNPEAEQAIVGAILAYPDLIADLGDTLTGTSFHGDAHRDTWLAAKHLHATGVPVDIPTVTHAIGERNKRHNPAVPALLTAWATNAPARDAVRHHVAIVHQLARQRGLADVASELNAIAARHYADTATIDSAYAYARHILDDLTPATLTATDRPQNIDEFLAGDEEDYDWVIPGLIERHDRVILTGPEGGGKSTMLRQWGIMAAAGMNPFTTDGIDPITVLHVDLENSHKQSRRKIRGMRIQAGDRLDPTRHYIEVRSSGIDLLDGSEHAWLLGLVDKVKPDLLLTGPIYKMASGDPNEERTAKAVSVALDRVRERGTAIVIEAHTPHAINGARKRPIRPYGASLWLRWPEFGIHLDDEGVIEHWRGARDEREWPTLLSRGGEWPWGSVTDAKEVRWTQIRRAREDFGQHMSFRDVAGATGIALVTVTRTIGAKGSHQRSWELLNGQPE